MKPRLEKIDHLHVYVKDLQAGITWYKTVFNLELISDKSPFAASGGPTVLGDEENNIYLALFEADIAPSSIIAFGATAEQFMQWLNYLRDELTLELRLADHKNCWSLYIEDPFGNTHEITCDDYHTLAKQLS